MDQTSLETTSLEGEVVENRNTITLEEADAGIRKGLKDAAQSVITVGYYLKVVRDNELYRSAGYETVWDYAWGEYGFSKSTAFRYMKRNDRFSIGGNSPIIADEFRAFNRSQLQEMLNLDEEQMERVTPEMTVREIRDIRKTKELPYYEIPGQLDISDFPGMEDAAGTENGSAAAEESIPMETTATPATFTVSAEDLIGETEEKLSAYGFPKRVYPADSLLTTPGCKGDDGRGYDCFSCHLECEIRQEYCHCVDATCGFPFPCQMVDTGKREILEKQIGESCRFIDLNLADHKAGDGSPVPCCKDCETPCEYACENSGKCVATSQQMTAADEQQETEENAAEKQQREAWVNPEEEQIDERCTIGNLPQAKESLIRHLATILVEKKWNRLAQEFQGVSVYTAKDQLKFLQDTQKLELENGIEAAACEDIIEFYRGSEDLGICSYEKFKTQVQKCVDAKWEQWRIANKKQPEESVATSQQNEQQPEHVEKSKNEKCIHDGISRCTLTEKDKEKAGTGEDCSHHCCWDCVKREGCNIECYASSKRKTLDDEETAAEDEENVEQPIEPIEFDKKTLENMIRNVQGTLDQMCDYWIKNQPYTYAKYNMMIQAYKLLLTEHETDQKGNLVEQQPELPLLKNDKQRAEFIDAYEAWPLWIDNQATGEKYYRYDLPDGTSMVIKTYHEMVYEWTSKTYVEGYGGNEQYLLQKGKFFRDCRANRSQLMKKLQELQKEENREEL